MTRVAYMRGMVVTQYSPRGHTPPSSGIDEKTGRILEGEGAGRGERGVLE